MRIGVLRERTVAEHRVSLSPAGVRTLVRAGQAVLVESGAGRAARFDDDEYRDAGALIAYDMREVFGRADILTKVSPLTPQEVPHLGEGQVVMGFHHLAAARREIIEALLASGATIVGYEVIEDAAGELPVLHAISEIAGELVVHIAAHCLQTNTGGRGILLGGATGVPAAHVVVLGAGTVGLRAARTAMGNGAQVTLLDTNLSALRRAEEALGRRVVTEMAHAASIERAVAFADVLVGAVLVRGERAPHVVSRGMVRTMKPGAVVVDVSIDQGGCVETSRPTTLDDPIYVEEGVIHYAVPNLTSAVARTASLALTYATLPYLLALAEQGSAGATRADPGLAAGVCIDRGTLVSRAVGRAFGMDVGRLRRPIAPAAATPDLSRSGT
jgi:alanine dehydrogenase